VVALAIVVGIALGLIAGLFRGIVEIAIMRLMDVILTLPEPAARHRDCRNTGTRLMNAMLAVTVVVLPHYVRITRAAVIGELSKDYVTAARSTGASRMRLMLREVLPNCAAPLIVQASLGVSTAILDAAALGFLGLGAQPPASEWGTMLADAREFVLRAWWVVTFPGIAILVTVLAFNLFGDGLRDALDPKLKR
jgi:dipeptide transport system permease protein